MHQIVILKLLHTASALIGVADDMGKQVFVRIRTDIVSVLILNGLRKDLSAGSINLSADILLKQCFFSLIVIVLKELLGILVRIDQKIDRHRRKQRADQSARHKNLLPNLGLFSQKCRLFLLCSSVISHRNTPRRQAHGTHFPRNGSPVFSLTNSHSRSGEPVGTLP